QKYCVSCYNKEQIHREVMMKMEKFIRFLKEKKQYTKIRRKRVQDLIRLNEMMSPLTFFLLEEGEISGIIDEFRLKAIKKGIEAIELKFKLDINNIHAINSSLIESLIPLWNYKRNLPKDKLNLFKEALNPIIDISNLSKDKLILLYQEFKKTSTVSYFTLSNKAYLIKYQPLFKYKKKYLLQIVKTYKHQIEKAASQPIQFKYFVNFLGNDCQFQTLNDKLKKTIQDYVLGLAKHDVDLISKRMINDINQAEQSNFIPNIAKYIMDNSEFIFTNWYTRILPFDKSRFMVSQAKTGSRTDFVVRLQYHFRSYELKMIENSLKESTETLLKAKTHQKIEKFRKNEQLSKEKRELKILKAKNQLEENLKPENLKKTQIENANGAPIIARFLLLNSEKAFNIVLNKIIRYFYKKLKIKTPVQYITNVLESGAVEKNRELKAFYRIHSREW
ncbi:MAG: hypothetical protein ACTSRX_05400, partial [Promethearchaeota archaeon]